MTKPPQTRLIRIEGKDSYLMQGDHTPVQRGEALFAYLNDGWRIVSVTALPFNPLAPKEQPQAALLVLEK